ncbi:MAG: conjugal transfer protein TraX [Clostridiales bacterium]|jgi:hypothetical protein|nr:conjugal transfer protein TraX [Clostridiales bacterium]
MTVFKLKIIACVTMLTDHFGASILLPMLGESVVIMEIYMLMRGIGRVAFPIFAYLIAQGCVHTKSVGKYLLRLGALAIISEPFFDMALGGGSVDFLRDTNIFVTLFLGAAAIALYEKVRQTFTDSYGHIIGLLAVLPAMTAAWLLSSDYAHLGVGIIFLIYMMRPQSQWGRIVAVTIGMTVLYINNTNWLLFSLLSVAMIALYNGNLGTNSPAIKWGFYFFYPVHLAALIALRQMIF